MHQTTILCRLESTNLGKLIYESNLYNAFQNHYEAINYLTTVPGVVVSHATSS